MDRLVLAVALAALAATVAVVLQRRARPPARPGAPSFDAPTELRRADFDRPDAPWLVVAFTSGTCETCAAVWERVRILDSDEVAVQEVEFQARGDLHERYGIDAVPITCVVDARGSVVASFVGPVSSTHLWGAVAEARCPGSVPPGCSGDGADDPTPS